MPTIEPIPAAATPAPSPPGVQQPELRTEADLSALPPPDVHGPVVIAGAGPAGAATALELARKGVKSILLEARAPSDTRENLLSIAPAVVDRLADLAPTGTIQEQLAPIESSWVRDDRTGRDEHHDNAGVTLQPDPSASRGDAAALLNSHDARPWGRIAIQDVANGFREVAMQHPELIEFRPNSKVVEIRQGRGFAEAVIEGPDGARDAVRGAFLVDATGGRLSDDHRTTYPETMHFVGSRFGGEPTARTARVHEVTDDGTPRMTVALSHPSRSIVWAQVPDAPHDMDDAQVNNVLASRRETVKVDGPQVEGSDPMRVTMRLFETTRPVDGRIIRVGDSTRSPYFPTSTGAAMAIVHDAPRVADAIDDARETGSWSLPSANFARSMYEANEKLMRYSRRAMQSHMRPATD